MRTLLCWLALLAASPALAGPGARFSVSVEVVRSARAGGHTASPDRLSLGPQKASAEFTLRNGTPRPARYLLRLVGDAASSPAGLLLFPREVTLRPEQQQVVRLALEGAAPGEARTWLVEVAPQGGPGPQPTLSLPLLVEAMPPPEH